MRPRRDRYRLGRRVDPAVPAQRGHRGEVPLQDGPAQAGSVQPQMIAGAVAAGHPLLHGRGHHIPRGQVAERVAAGHDRPPGRVHQHRARPAQRLGEQRALAGGRFLPQHGRVELHELEVPQLGTGPGGQRQAVAGHPGRAGRRRVGLAEPAGGQHDRTSPDRARPQHPVAAGEPGEDPADRAPVIGQRVQGDAAGQDLDRAGGRGLIGQRRRQDPVQLGPDRVAAGVHDPVAAVAALQVQRGPLQPGPAPGQPVDLAGRRGDQRRHRGRVAQPRARRERVPAGAAPGRPPARSPRPGRPGPAASRPRPGPPW